MNAFTNIDMNEVTRLTKAGRLSDAMAMLRGGASSPPNLGGSPGFSAGPPGAARPAIDMVPSLDGAWDLPDFAAAPAGKASNSTARADVPKAMRPFLDRIGKFRSGSGFGGLPRSPHAPASTPLPDGARFEQRSFANSAGHREYKLYVPSGYEGNPLPLVVMLHGCTQSPDDFAAGTRMNELAEEHTFLVAYPAQTQAANASKCWNWFSAGDQHRDGGEPSLIAGITSRIVHDLAVDPERIYVAGLSAGGAAAAIMGSAYPDLYAAVGVHSGLACGAASDMPSAFAAMRGGAAPLRGGGGSRRTHRRVVPTIVFHGDRDKTVNPVNGEQVIDQAIAGMRLETTIGSGKSPGGTAFTRTVRRDKTGHPVMEQWVLHGAGHAWSGGSSAGSYTDPRGPDASREMLRFFLQQPKPSSSQG